MSQSSKGVLPTPAPGMVLDAFNRVLDSAGQLARVINEEKTKREQTHAWEATQLEIIRVQRDFLLTGLDKTFDERRDYFRRLFDNLDAAFESEAPDAGARASEILGAITELAQTSPFKDLKSPAIVVQEFLQNGKVIEL